MPSIEQSTAPTTRPPLCTSRGLIDVRREDCNATRAVVRIQSRFDVRTRLLAQRPVALLCAETALDRVIARPDGRGGEAPCKNHAREGRL